MTDIHQALSKLSKHDREMLLLSAWDGLTPREIAIVVGISPNKVRVRLHRIRIKLRKQVSRSHPNPTQANDRELDSNKARRATPVDGRQADELRARIRLRYGE